LTVLALVATASAAERLPDALGVNLYWNVQLWPPASAVFTAQVPLRAKSPGFAPPAVSVAIVSVPPPVFVNVTVFAALVDRTLMVLKFSEDALSVAIGAAGAAAAAASVTVNVAPPMLRFVLRCAPVFAAADQPMDAPPVPLVAVDTVSQLAPLPMLHVQAAPVVSVKLPVPPPAATLALVGLSVYVQALAWLTVKLWLPMAIVALRAGPTLAVAE